MNKKLKEFLLKNKGVDFTISDIAEGMNISKPKAYGIIEMLEGKGYLIKTKLVGGTQFYELKRVKNEKT